jgi:hypothetical protein
MNLTNAAVVVPDPGPSSRAPLPLGSERQGLLPARLTAKSVH